MKDLTPNTSPPGEGRKIILASASPRRQQLLKELGVDFTVEVKPVDETAPKELKAEQIPIYLSQLKAAQFKNTVDEHTLVITADTIVWINEKEIGKPKDYADAVNMLKTLSGNMHTVFTGVTLTSKNKQHSFFVATKVYFKKLSDSAVADYVSTYKPFDKAGSYGLQEFLSTGINPCSDEENEFLKKIGKPNLYEATLQGTHEQSPDFGIEKIEGSYFNVMGLPLMELYEELGRF
ncbi:MAG: Maf-like protein YhdE [Bacteroidia bacterium]|nr:Maf-like protein YhdE [Bacteroidia bacterium]